MQLRHQVRVILVILMMAMSESLSAQVGITAVPFLEINNDARSAGLAGADVAKISRNGLHLNPAALGPVGIIQLTSPFNRDNGVPFFSTNWLRSFNYSGLSYASPKLIIGFDKLVIGYQYNRLHLGQRVITDERTPDVISILDSYEVNQGFSFSYPISDYVSIGSGINFIKSDLASGLMVGEYKVEAAKQVSFDFGVYGQRPVELEKLIITPSVGWSLTDFGYGMKYANAKEDPLPIVMRAGLGLKVDVNEYLWGLRVLSFAGYGALSKIMARYEVVEINDENGNPIVIDYEAVGPFEALVKSWDTYTRFNGQEYVDLTVWEQFRRHSGFEVTFLEILTLRSGHFYEHQNNGARVYDTFGIGIEYKYFSFDYSQYYPDEEDHPLDGTEFYQLSIHVPLDDVTGVFKK